VGPDQSREVRVLVTQHQRPAPQASIPLSFTIVPLAGGMINNNGNSLNVKE
jgi:hypothetical protein